jgi:hypothetical protein
VLRYREEKKLCPFLPVFFFFLATIDLRRLVAKQSRSWRSQAMIPSGNSLEQ